MRSDVITGSGQDGVPVLIESLKEPNQEAVEHAVHVLGSDWRRCETRTA